MIRIIVTAWAHIIHPNRSGLTHRLTIPEGRGCGLCKITNLIILCCFLNFYPFSCNEVGFLQVRKTD